MKNRHQAVFLSALVLIMASCASRQIVIPETLSAAEMVQRAQEASDRNQYGVSLQYYEAIKERFPANLEYVCAAEYEIAFIHYKQKKTDSAKAEFTSLLDRYASPDQELLPQEYRVLSQKILTLIAEEESPGQKPTAEE